MQYICEHCGKVTTEKFGSGRFCCRACANSRKQTEKANTARSNKLKKYVLAPVLTCVICGKKFNAPKRPSGHYCLSVKTCSAECLSKLKSKNALGNSGGGFREGSAKNYKYGSYAGIYCDSSWELAYVVFCLEHNISIERNNIGFDYIYNNKSYRYYPDFLVNGNEYVEIKNFVTPQVLAKQEYFPKDLVYKILYKQDLNSILDYCISKYGKDFPEVLYDRTKKSYLDNR